MDISHIILVFVVMLLLAVLGHPLAAWLRIPFSALLVVIGFVSATVITGLGFDIGLRWYHVEALILNVLLPVLIFESALNIDVRQLMKNLPQVSALALPAMLISTVTIGAVLFYAIDHPSGFPWIAALICGALLSATDPVAVLTTFKHFHVSERLSVIMEGESLFNDAVAIVLFSVLLAISTSGTLPGSWHAPLLEFIYVFLGGLGLGLVLGVLGAAALRLMKQPLLGASLSVAVAYLAYIIAEEGFHMSGVVAVLACGLLLGRVAKGERYEAGPFILSLWQFLAFVADSVVFLLVGITVTLQMFADMWLAILFGLVAVLLARALGVFTFLPLINRIPGTDTTPRPEQTVIYWGGLRGAVAVALALSLPVELEYWYPIQSITYGVVLFSLFVQAPTLPLLLRRFKTG